MTFLILLIVLVALVILANKLPAGCQRDCNQGRNCDCTKSSKDQ